MNEPIRPVSHTVYPAIHTHNVLRDQDQFYGTHIDEMTELH